MSSMVRSEIASSMRSIARARKSPTPTPTVSSRVAFGMACTLVASTCRSGSARVMAVPRAKLVSKITQSLREAVMALPMCPPMRDMDSSAPTENMPMPRIICTAPSRKASIRPEGMGTNRKHTAATMAVMGRMELMDSCSFSNKSFFCVMEYSRRNKNYTDYTKARTERKSQFCPCAFLYEIFTSASCAGRGASRRLRCSVLPW